MAQQGSEERGAALLSTPQQRLQHRPQQHWEHQPGRSSGDDGDLERLLGEAAWNQDQSAGVDAEQMTYWFPFDANYFWTAQYTSPAPYQWAEEPRLQHAEEEIAACAPPPPAPGAYAPPWPYGPTWPFTAAPTTLELRRLPKELTRDDLLEVLDKLGFSGFYDFVFLEENCNSRHEGCAVVNLTRHAYGLSLAPLLHGNDVWGIAHADRHCDVRWLMSRQGLQEQMDHYSQLANLPVDSDPPLYFVNGWQRSFPAI